jgi:hypothetical protein
MQLRSRLALLAFGLLAGACAARPVPTAQVAGTELTSAETVAALCTAVIIPLDDAAVAPDGPYELVGTIDLSRPSLYDRFGTEERVRHRACAMHADAAGRLASASGSGYVAVKRRLGKGSVLVPIKISDPPFEPDEL